MIRYYQLVQKHLIQSSFSAEGRLCYPAELSQVVMALLSLGDVV